MSQIVIEIAGTPAPQGSKSAVVRAGRAVLIEGSSSTGRAKHQAWRTAVTAAALTQVPYADRVADPDVAVSVDVVFVMPRPKSRSMRLVWHRVKPDIDKLFRSTLDGLADGKAMARDQQVAWLGGVKQYEVGRGGWTGATVTITPLNDDRDT